MMLIRRTAIRCRVSTARLQRPVQAFSSRPAGSAVLPTSPLRETEEWGLFPREREGNEYDVNWSLTNDGIVSTGDAFHNARLPVLTARLPGKVAAGKIEVSSPEYYGDVTTLEAGESISFDDFENAFSAHKEYMSRGADLLIEDRGLGTYGPFRLGTRIVTDNAATALIFRNLLIQTPPRKVDHKARFNGWNFDERWNVAELVWDGSTYEQLPGAVDAQPGQRPLLATIGGNIINGKAAAVQFVEVNSSLVGANVIAGSATSVLGLVDAIGYAYIGTLNEQVPDAVALPSLSLINGKDTTLVVGAVPDEFVQSALSKNVLYGAYHNVISTAGTSAVWNGVISPVAGDISADTPAVVVKGSAVRVVNPNNLAFAPTSLFFYEAGAKKTKLSTEDAVKRLVSVSGEENKEALFAEIVKSVKNIQVISSIKDVF